MRKVVLVDWNGGGDFCGNSKFICDESEAAGAPSGSTRTERSEGEGWSRAREKRPPEWKSTASKRKSSPKRISVSGRAVDFRLSSKNVLYC